MDEELLAELRAIQAGDVTEAHRCRTAFRQADAILREKLSALDAVLGIGAAHL